MVVDASALLAVAFNEPAAHWVLAQLRSALTGPQMSSVNFAEVLIRIRSRFLETYRDPEAAALQSPMEIVSVSPYHARIAASARLRFPLNLGDCFAYALARSLQEPLLTLDAAFRKTDLALIMPPEA